MPAPRDLWTLPIDWSRGFEEEIAWRTNVITSRNGKEQRIALRAKPRLTYTFTSFLAKGGLEAAILRVAEQQGRTLYIPYPRHLGVIGVPSDAGALVINLLAVLSWLADASFAAVINIETGSIELVEITSVSGLTATLQEPLQRSAPTRSKVMKVREGRLADSIDIRAGTNRAGTTKVVFDADPVTAPLSDYGPAPETFNGIELFEMPPNWAGGVQHGFEQYRLDLTKGAVDAAFPVAFTSRSAQYHFLLRNDDQFNHLLGLFYRTRGWHKSFYMPLWLSEFTPISEIAIPFDGKAYQSITICRDKIASSGTLDRTTLEIQINPAAEVVQLYRSGAPSHVVHLTIYQGHVDDPAREFLVVWTGRIISINQGNRFATIAGEPVSTVLGMVGLRRHSPLVRGARLRVPRLLEKRPLGLGAARDRRCANEHRHRPDLGAAPWAVSRKSPKSASPKFGCRCVAAFAKARWTRSLGLS